MATPQNFWIGPSGWARSDWAAAVGAENGRHGHVLELLARYTDLAEIDQTFYEPLKPEIAGLYARKVSANPRFQFTAMLGRRFTYDRDLDTAAVAAWKPGLFSLMRARKLGAVVMQFPWAFRFTAENREFLIQLRRAFHEFPLAAEFRHESWLREEALGTLIDYRVGLVNVDQPLSFRSTPPTALFTTGVAVVRMHGRQSPEAFQGFDPEARVRPHLYGLDEMEEWLPRVRRLATNAPRTLVVMANRGNGFSMVNALQMREMLGAAPLLAPAGLIRNFPAELAAFRSNRPVQTSLLAARAVA